MPKYSLLALCLVFCLSGCNRDDDVHAFSQNLDSFTNEVMDRMEGDGDLSGRVDAAQAYVDENGPALHAEYMDIAQVRGFQLSNEASDELVTSVTRNSIRVMGLQLEHVGATFNNRDLDQRLGHLSESYEGILELPEAEQASF